MNNAVAANNYRLAHLAYTRFIPAAGTGSGGGLVVATIALLRSSISSAAAAVALQVTVQGATAANDGGGGIYTWDSTGNDADDGNSTIRPSDFATVGLWRKLL
jgi:hypothetical protein